LYILVKSAQEINEKKLLCVFGLRVFVEIFFGYNIQTV